MKQQCMIIAIRCFKWCMNLVYRALKCLPQQRKVVFLSRQSDQIPLDFALVREELESQPNPPKLVFLCKTMPQGLVGKCGYGFHLLRAMYHLATARVAVLDTYSIPVGILKHRPSLTVIQIWHALGAVKKFGKQILGKQEGSSEMIADLMGMHQNYSKVYAPSEKTATFYAKAFGVDPTIIEIKGMPRIDYIQHKTGHTKEQLYARYPKFAGKPLLVYLPTFRKGQHLDTQHLIQAIDHNRYQLVIKPHPLDHDDTAKDYLVDEQFTSYDLMQMADAIITDYSAISIEASLLQKPIYFYVYDFLQYQDTRGLNIDLFQQMDGMISTKASEIFQMIDQKPYDMTVLTQFRNEYVQTWAQNNTKIVAKDILDAC